MKTTKEQRQKITDWIEWQELCRNGLKQLCGAYTTVTALKIRKSTSNPKQRIFTYNLVLGEQDLGDGHSRQEKYNDTEMAVLDSTINSIINQ